MQNHFSRRQFIKHSVLFTGAAVSLPLLPDYAADTNAPAAPPAANLLTLEASARSLLIEVSGRSRAPVTPCHPQVHRRFQFPWHYGKSDRAMGGQTNCEFACPGRMTIARLAPDLSGGKMVTGWGDGALHRPVIAAR
jgi:hypothetical protein